MNCDNSIEVIQTNNVINLTKKILFRIRLKQFHSFKTVRKLYENIFFKINKKLRHIVVLDRKLVL